mmetsp:Transcript_24896/g.78815  ORF Transcript_24896/g.78815 Transcript_24896/m.78815 type:complete len:292 (-) Transcript_24896:95-970(-)
MREPVLQNQLLAGRALARARPAHDENDLPVIFGHLGVIPVGLHCRWARDIYKPVHCSRHHIEHLVHWRHGGDDKCQPATRIHLDHGDGLGHVEVVSLHDGIGAVVDATLPPSEAPALHYFLGAVQGDDPRGGPDLLFEGRGLLESPREPVNEELLGTMVHPRTEHGPAHNTHHDRGREQVPARHHLLCHLPEVRPLCHLLAEQVARGQVHARVARHYLGCLRPLAAARPAQQEGHVDVRGEIGLPDRAIRHNGRLHGLLGRRWHRRINDGLHLRGYRVLRGWLLPRLGHLN